MINRSLRGLTQLLGINLQLFQMPSDYFQWSRPSHAHASSIEGHTAQIMKIAAKKRGSLLKMHPTSKICFPLVYSRLLLNVQSPTHKKCLQYGKGLKFKPPRTSKNKRAIFTLWLTRYFPEKSPIFKPIFSPIFTPKNRFALNLAISRDVAEKSAIFVTDRGRTS